jgi:hypothetical protein
MIKSKATVFLILIIAGIVAAGYQSQEKKFDLFLATGYGFGVGGYQNAAEDFSSTISDGNLISREAHYRNFGWGIKIEGGADYKLMDHVFGQAAFTYGFSAVPGTENVHEVMNASETSAKYYWSVYGIKAGIKPTFQILDLLDMYTNIGIGLYFANSGVDLRITTIGGSESTSKGRDSNNPAMTLIGAIGAEYPINESVIAFAEVNFEQMSFTTTKTSFTQSSGVFYSDHTVNYQVDATDRSAPPKIPGSNVALRVGVRFPLF